MDKELSDSLKQLIDLITNTVSKTGDFAVEQLPDIASQYVTYGIVWHSICILSTCAFIALYMKFIFFTRTKYEEIYEMPDHIQFLIMSGGLGSIMSIIELISSARNLCLAVFAPKLYILQGIAGLISK